MMFSCSFVHVEENQQNVGCTSSSVGLMLQNILFPLTKTARQIILSIQCETWSFARDKKGVMQ